MKDWNTSDENAVYDDIRQLNSPCLPIAALESFANMLDDQMQSELFRKLILSHAEIACRRLRLRVMHHDGVRDLPPPQRRLHEQIERPRHRADRHVAIEPAQPVLQPPHHHRSGGQAHQIAGHAAIGAHRQRA